MAHSCPSSASAKLAKQEALVAMHRRLTVALFLAIVLHIGATAWADDPYARSRDYDLQNARIALCFDLERRKVMGEVTHTLAALRDGLPRLTFDSVALAILSVAVNGQPAKFETTATQLLVTLDRPAKLGERFEVSIRYEGRPRKGFYFVLPDKNYPDRPREVWTQGEAEDTRYYIPIYDYPNDRTSTEMILTVPRDWVTVSNGKLVGVTGTAGGMKTWHWKQSQPHSTYLISLVAGEFELMKETWRNIPVTYYVPRGSGDRVKPTFARTEKMLEFYADLLGVPYPWDQYAQTAVDDFVVGGMENTSATTLTTSVLVHPQLAGESLMGSDGVVSHEMAHQWFGDLVTCKDWANLWLNEGFATYFATLWEEHFYGADEAAYSLWRSRNGWMNSQRLYPVPIVTRNFTDATEYAGNLYTKAGWVLHMLRQQLGDAGFYAALKHYLQTYRGQNVVSADLAKAIEEATATNVDAFFDQWIYGAGAPRFEVRYAYDDAARHVKLEVKQTQKVEGRVGVFRAPVEIEITTTEGKKSLPVTITRASETYTFPVEGPPRLVLFDKGNKILKSVEFQKDPQEWIYQLKNAEAVPDRLDAARALSEVKNNEEVAAALGEAARRDAFWGVRVESLRALGRIGGPAAQKQILAALGDERPWVRQVVVELMGTFKDDATLADRLKTIFREDKAYRVRAEALASFARQKPSGGLALLQAAAATDSPDDRLRIAALRAMATLGDDQAVPVLLEWSATGKPFPVRAGAITSLGRLGRKNKAITQRLIAYLPENYRAVRSATISALGECGDPDAIAPLEALLKSGELSEGQEALARGVLDRLKQAAAAGENK
jgi:aminopeptidase N